MHILRTINLTLLIFVFLAPCKLGHLTLEDYQIWSVKSALANEFLNLLFQVGTSHDAVVQVVLMLKYLGFFLHLFVFVSFQVCHIVLGLRPGTPEEEGQIIRFKPALILCHVVVYGFDEKQTHRTFFLSLLCVGGG